MKQNARQWRKGGADRRRGGAVVEMAVVSPLLLTLVFGVIEFGNAFMVRQMLTNAAREGARVAAIQTVVDEVEIRDAVRDAMAALGGIEIEDEDIEITHWCKEADGTPDFTETVQITVEYDQIDIFGHAEMGGGSTAAPEHPHGVGIIYHQACTILLADGYQFRQGSDVALHAE